MKRAGRAGAGVDYVSIAGAIPLTLLNLPPFPSGSWNFFDPCNDKCATQGRRLKSFKRSRESDHCNCCISTGNQATSCPGYSVWQVVPPSTTTTSANAASVDDPHIKTLDVKRYTLLSQGTFSLWRYSGVEAELPWPLKKVPVDWEVYTHYSGHQSFTKGLLLLDRTGGEQVVHKGNFWKSQQMTASGGPGKARKSGLQSKTKTPWHFPTGILM